MSKLRLIGDVHGHIGLYKDCCKGCDESIQIGDMGVGFKGVILPNMNGTQKRKDIPGKHMFFRGNHDAPDPCRVHPNYLGDWGFDSEKNLFWIGGADSIDKAWRIIGISWWDNEELTHNQCWDMIAAFEKHKPKFVVSHDCPQAVMQMLWPYTEQSRTRMALQTCLDIHQPELWVFGHHHDSRTCNFKGTEFRCLNELETMDIELNTVSQS